MLLEDKRYGPAVVANTVTSREAGPGLKPRTEHVLHVSAWFYLLQSTDKLLRLNADSKLPLGVCDTDYTPTAHNSEQDDTVVRHWMAGAY